MNKEQKGDPPPEDRAYAGILFSETTRARDPVVEYRMIGDDPSVVEQVYTYPSSSPKSMNPDSVHLDPIHANVENDSNLRRSFTVHAAFWLISCQESVSKLSAIASHGSFRKSDLL